MRDVRPTVDGVETEEAVKTEEPEEIQQSGNAPVVEKKEANAVDEEGSSKKLDVEGDKPDEAPGEGNNVNEETAGETEDVAEEAAEEEQKEEEEKGSGEKPTGPKHPAYCDECRALRTGNEEEEEELIIGVRWKCMVCEWYDLCDKCHSAGVHDEHQMLKIEHPDDALDIEQPVSDFIK